MASYKVGDLVMYKNPYGYSHYYLVKKVIGGSVYDLVTPNLDGTMPKRRSATLYGVEEKLLRQ